MIKTFLDMNKENKFILPKFNSSRNWTEDYTHENGHYLCNCYKCGEYFYGHKRRVGCKECTKTVDNNG